MTLVPKAIIGSVLTVGVGLSAWGSHALTTPANVKEQLIKEGGHLDLTNIPSKSDTSSHDYEEWKKILNGGGNSENTEAKVFGAWEEETTDEYQKINKLKEKCTEKLNTSYSDSSYGQALTDARKFCVKKK